MGLLEGKVAFISGGARGQGRSHAVRMAEEGADVVTFDLCAPVSTVAGPPATEEDLEETVRLVEKTGRRIVARTADVRDHAAVQAVLDDGLAELGRVDIVVANAGIMPIVGETGASRQAWHDAIDIMLTGVLHTCEAAIPRLVEQGEGGCMLLTSSVAGLKGTMRELSHKTDGLLGYIAAKHGVVGLMRAYANALAPHRIRCNTVHPTGVATPMVLNEAFFGLAAEKPTLLETLVNALPVPFIEVDDVSNAMIFLASDAGRYITGVILPVDAGASNR